MAKKMLMNKDYYRLGAARGSHASPWWSEYNGEAWVFIDEYEPGWLDTCFLFQMIDYGECRIKIYGEEKQLLATNFVITSNFHPYLWVKEDLRRKPWLRRVDEFFEIIEVIKKPETAAA